MDAQLAETCAVIDDLGRVFSTADDVDTVRGVVVSQRKLYEAAATAAAQTKQIVRVMSHNVEKLRQHTEQNNSDAITKRREQLTAVRDEAAATLGEYEREVEARSSKVTKLADEAAELEAEITAEEAAAAADVPALKNSIKLYTNITNIVWNYDSADVVVGDMHMPNTQQVRHFELTPAQSQSRSATADALWDMLWTDQATTPAAAAVAAC